MFEELLVCLGEIYAGVEQKITEMNTLKAENEAVKAENEAIKADNEAMKAEMAEMKAMLQAILAKK